MPEPFEVVEAEKKPSALGAGAKRRPSKLLRITDPSGRNQNDVAVNMPPRSPVGAIRQNSGFSRQTSTINQERGDAAVKRAEEEDDGLTKTQWHSLPLETVFKLLNTSETDGIKSANEAALIQKHGYNELTPPAKKSTCAKFFLSLVSGFQLMMNVGAILCFIVFGISKGKDIQTLALGIMLIVVAWLTSAFQIYQEGKADNIMEELKALTADKTWVVRDGTLQEINGKKPCPRRYCSS